MGAPEPAICFVSGSIADRVAHRRAAALRCALRSFIDGYLNIAGGGVMADLDPSLFSRRSTVVEWMPEAKAENLGRFAWQPPCPPQSTSHSCDTLSRPAVVSRSRTTISNKKSR